eukprot:m.92725 g.92725  ORF g.92725 m.92725 type:complete len:301 (-) comp8659_c0_seq1:1798-2700(-)
MLPSPERWVLAPCPCNTERSASARTQKSVYFAVCESESMAGARSSDPPCVPQNRHSCATWRAHLESDESLQAKCARHLRRSSSSQALWHFCPRSRQLTTVTVVEHRAVATAATTTPATIVAPVPTPPMVAVNALPAKLASTRVSPGKVLALFALLAPTPPVRGKAAAPTARLASTRIEVANLIATTAPPAPTTSTRSAQVQLIAYRAQLESTLPLLAEAVAAISAPLESTRTRLARLAAPFAAREATILTLGALHDSIALHASREHTKIAPVPPPASSAPLAPTTMVSVSLSAVLVRPAW